MKPTISGRAEADLTHQYRWYLDNAGEPVAERFLAEFDATVARLARFPELGRRRCFRARVTVQRMVGRRSDWWLISAEGVALFSCRGGNVRHRTGCTPRRHWLRLGRCVNLVREKAPFPVRFLTRRLTCNE